MTNTIETITLTETAPRIMATVYFQVWQNNYAVDVDQAKFDCTDLYLAMSDEDRAGVKDNTDISDGLYLDAVKLGLAPRWIEFGTDRTIVVHVEDAIADYLEATAA